MSSALFTGRPSADLAEEHGQSSELHAQALSFQKDAVALRRSLHRHPEIGNNLPVTREQVLTALDGLPLDITLHKTTSGIAALLTGDKPGPTVLLRGDMDALPMPEDTGLDFSSVNKNIMHACGHDTHGNVGTNSANVVATQEQYFWSCALYVSARRRGLRRRAVHAR